MPSEPHSPLAQPRPAASLKILGHFDLRIDRHSVYLPPAAQRLLVYLALHAHGVPRERAAELLWPDLPHARAGASLRSALWRICRRGDQRLVDLDAARLAVCEHVDVDLHAATRYAAALANGPADEAPDAEVPALLCEDLLPGWYDDWLTDTREHFHQTRLHALEATSRHHRRHGRMWAAMTYAMTAVEAEPLRESAHREITATHLAEGNTAEALRHFESYRRRLRSELGLCPSTDYRRLLAPYLSRPTEARRQ
ncbi:BTAD domain-containing putative transcriptional regulator [Streptomyces sp. NPDC085995]|uniref:AfsR/SARP family transcriptional regulator n=1 Tax=Streptomyces sp. NPDC085995 TaxID=3154861 RepID=UPI00341EACB4